MFSMFHMSFTFTFQMYVKLSSVRRSPELEAVRLRPLNFTRSGGGGTPSGR